MIKGFPTDAYGTMAEVELVHPDISQRLQIAIVPLVVLLILYYGYLHTAYETTIKRTLYESAISSIPEPLWRFMQQLAWRFNGLLPFSESESKNVQGKSGQLQKTISGQGLPAAVQKARSLSGFDRFVNNTTDSSYPGLGNWDNSCFQNSILQGLASLSAFARCIDEEWRTCLTAETDAPALNGLRNFLGQLQEATKGRQTIWPPSVLRSMNTWQQQDAQEYLSTILDSIEKEITKAHRVMVKRSNPGLGCLRNGVYNEPGLQDPRSETPCEASRAISTHWSLPSSLEGSLSQKLRCQKCGFSEGLSLTAFNCLTLTLGIGGGCDLESLLDTYFDPELIDGVECDECTRLANCSVIGEEISKDAEKVHELPKSPEALKRGAKTLSTKAKHVLFGRLPSNLAFHINRSIFDDWGNQRKNNSYVAFPPTLKIWNDWVESFGDGTTDIHAVYELRCIINHSGRHDNGHYVACGKRGKDWFLFNDEVVSRINESDVLARGNVFMLFYERLDSASILEVSTPKSEISQEGSPDLQGNPTTYEQDSTPVVVNEMAAIPSATNNTSPDHHDVGLRVVLDQSAQA